MHVQGAASEASGSIIGMISRLLPGQPATGASQTQGVQHAPPAGPTYEGGEPNGIADSAEGDKEASTVDLGQVADNENTGGKEEAF